MDFILSFFCSFVCFLGFPGPSAAVRALLATMSVPDPFVDFTTWPAGQIEDITLPVQHALAWAEGPWSQSRGWQAPTTAVTQHTIRQKVLDPPNQAMIASKTNPHAGRAPPPLTPRISLAHRALSECSCCSICVAHSGASRSLAFLPKMGAGAQTPGGRTTVQALTAQIGQAQNLTSSNFNGNGVRTTPNYACCSHMICLFHGMAQSR